MSVKKIFLAETSIGKLVHLSHLEDVIWSSGVPGAQEAIRILTDVKEILRGSSKSRINISTKWDGCLHQDTKIITNLGLLTIKEIRDKWHINSEISVLGQLDGREVFVPVLDVFASKSSKPWVKIDFDNETSMILTEDHLVMTKNGWKKAVELSENDDLEVSSPINN